MSTGTHTNKPGTQFYFSCNQTQEALLEKYQRTRSFTEKLCQPLQVEDYVVQSMENVSPTKWHLGHTSWFFETFVLGGRDNSYQSPSPEYSYLFNSYYVQAGERYPRSRRGLITRPGVQEVFDYRRQIDEHMIRLLQEMDGPALQETLPLVEIGINHEQQHQELILTDVKHVFSFNPLHPAYRESRDVPVGSVPEMEWRTFHEEVYQIGHLGNNFCFDNELPRHKEFVQGFALASRLVTNQEYLQFMADDCYSKPTLWLSEGWYAVEQLGWQAPLYWQKKDGEWYHFTLNGLCKVNPAEPVCHVSYFEADAFARWAGFRLPSETEWEVASADLPWEGNFVASRNYHPLPLQDSLNGSLAQMFGDVWEWTKSPYVGYPGYKPMGGALGEYNGKFMSSQLVLRGGACTTSQDHIRNTYRNFFAPSTRWQFTGIRLAQDS